MSKVSFSSSEIIEKSDAIIVVGTRISLDSPDIKYPSNAQFIYMHPMDDKALESKYTQFIKYEVGSEEGVIALLASYIVKDMPESYKVYFDDLDIGYLSGESSVGEEELEELEERLIQKSNKTLVIGEDIYNHPQSSNIMKIVGVIAKYTDFNVVTLNSNNYSIDENDIDLEEVSDISTYNGTVVYSCKVPEENESLVGSDSFAIAAKIRDNDMVNIIYNKQNTTKKFKVDKSIKGTVALYPALDDDLISSGYRFKQVQITKVEK